MEEAVLHPLQAVDGSARERPGKFGGDGTVLRAGRSDSEQLAGVEALLVRAGPALAHGRQTQRRHQPRCFVGTVAGVLASTQSNLQADGVIWHEKAVGKHCVGL